MAQPLFDRRALIGLAIVAAVATSVGCGSSVAPSGTGQSGAAAASSGGGGGTTGGGATSTACRAYPTALTSTDVSFTGTITTALTCTPYNRTTNDITCSGTVSGDGLPTVSTQTTTHYASVSDFVGDAPRFAGVASTATRPASNHSTSTWTGGNSSSSQTYIYDAQRRIVRLDNVQQTNGGTGQSTTAYTAWDAYGRPTASTSESGSFTTAYDDSGRTVTSTGLLSTGAVVTIVQTFDVNGNLIRTETRVVIGPSTVTDTSTTVTTATARECV